MRCVAVEEGYARVAQLDRALASGAKGRRFDPCRAHVSLTLSKTLAEIAIDAGLVNKADASRAGRLAESKQQPLIVVLVRDLGVDEIALVAAMHKQMRVQLLDPTMIHLDPDALRELPKDAGLRLHVLPLTIGTDAAGARVMRVAMADPTDTSAIAELEQITQCEIELSALPLSIIDAWIEKAYQGLTTEVIKLRPSSPSSFVASKLVTTKVYRAPQPMSPLSGNEGEVSETAQIVLRHTVALGDSLTQMPDLDLRLAALTRLLIAKNIITPDELDAQLQELLQLRNDSTT